MKIATIFGGGFGLYGYIAALKATGFDNFIISNRHKGLMERKQNLLEHIKNCFFVEDVDMLSLPSDLVVFAVNPKKQEDLIANFISQTPKKILLLEKPLGANPYTSKRLVYNLKSNRIKYGCNYIFLYTTWFQELLNKSNEFNNLQIFWSFKANHLTNNIHTWKRVRSEGGGLIRFYGIHLIYIASVLGFLTVIKSEVEVTSSGDDISWCCTLEDRKQRQLLIHVNICAPTSKFDILCDKSQTIELPDPFELDAPEDVTKDRRHNLIKKHILSSISKHQASDYTNEYNAILLWRDIEIINTKFES